MKFFNLFKSKRKRSKSVKRSFGAAEIGRLTNSLTSQTEYINKTLRYEARILRARSRQLAKSNPYVKRFTKMYVNNICGDMPFKLQAKSKFKNGTLDKTSNDLIEQEWKNWSKKGTCDTTKRWSLNTFLRLAVNNLAVDGEILIRKIGPGSARNKYGFRLQLLDIDRLDDQKNLILENGNNVHMGIEVDSNFAPVNYYIKKSSINQASNGSQGVHEIVPAKEIEHIFIPEFAEQNRGIPPIYATMLNLAHLGAFEEAAVIAARIGASQMGFIQSPDYGDGTVFDSEDLDGRQEIEAEPGFFNYLAPGEQLASWNPKYPDAAMEPFVTSCLHGIAAGLDVAHHNLSGNMSNVNYSSARIAELSERDMWKTLQNHIIEHLIDPIYSQWLETSALMGALPFQVKALTKYKDVRWQAKRWAWVDPQKETNAAVMAIENKLKSRTNVIAESGGDIEDVFSDLQNEESMLKEKGLKQESIEQEKPSSLDEDEEEKRFYKRSMNVKQNDIVLNNTFEIPAPQVVVNNRSEYIESPPITIENRIPESNITIENKQNDPVVNISNIVETPVVNVEAPNVSVENIVETPDVTVNNNMPESDRKVRFSRDNNGKIVGATIRDE